MRTHSFGCRALATESLEPSGCCDVVRKLRCRERNDNFREAGFRSITAKMCVRGGGDRESGVVISATSFKVEILGWTCGAARCGFSDRLKCSEIAERLT